MTESTTKRITSVRKRRASEGRYGLLSVVFVIAAQATSLSATNDIPALVAQLGAAKHREREHAEHQLWLCGESARPFLEQAAQSADPEVRQRARAVLEKFDLGLRPDMPDSVQQLIRRFHQCDSDECRRLIVSSLLQTPSVETKTLLAQLAQRLPSVEQRIVVFAPVGELMLGQVLESVAADMPPRDEKLAALIEGLDLYLAVVPEDLTTPLNLVVWLREHGEDRARPVVELAARVQQQRLERAPDSAELHNNLAWLLAVSRVRLDEALHHAQRAVELEPRQPAYLDTLAEVHFQRGDRQKALELIARCIELDPESTYFRDQEQRFRDGKPETPPPDPELVLP
ncbi:MAG: hypothetical protein NZ483_11405 [Verrucomicrobiae bacterium]|nr:hypothetical protein [Verrucomicrobiae bacterium]